MVPSQKSDARNRIALGAILGLGFFFTIANLQLPIVRNSLIYARISSRLLDHHMKAWEVCGSPEAVLDKACGFSLLAAPLARLLGANQALKWVSFLGTAAFVLAAYAFFRRFNRRFGLEDRDIPFELAVSCFNPLVIYQFWSAYPDTLFFAGFVVSFVILDILITADRAHPWRWAAAYFAVLTFSIFVKHWGLLLFPIHAVYIYWHRAALAARRPEGRRRLVAITSALLLTLAFVGLGRAGLNPLLNLRSNEGQYDAPIVYLHAVEQFIWFCVTNLGLLLLLTPRIKLRSSDAVVALSAIVYAHMLMVYTGATYNARYYIPILPFLAPYLARAWGTIGSRVIRRVAPAAFLAVNAALILVFNFVPAHQVAGARLPPSWFKSYGYLDSYRMRAHLEADAALANLNLKLPRGARLYYISSYYGDASHNVYEQSGLLRRDLRISYMTELAKPVRLAQELYLFYPGSGSRPRELFQIADGLGHGLYRIAPAPPRSSVRMQQATAHPRGLPDMAN